MVACSVVGAVLIVVGLYTVIWGKGRDMDAVEETAANGDEETNNADG